MKYCLKLFIVNNMLEVNFQKTIESIENYLLIKDYRNALEKIFILLDISAKDTYSNLKGNKNRERFVTLFKDNIDFIFWFASKFCIFCTNGIFFDKVKNSQGFPMTLEEVLYDIRCTLFHNGGSIKFDIEEGQHIIKEGEEGIIILNTDIVVALFILLLYLPCNVGKVRQTSFRLIRRDKIFLGESVLGKGKQVAILKIKLFIK